MEFKTTNRAKIEAAELLAKAARAEVAEVPREGEARRRARRAETFARYALNSVRDAKVALTRADFEKLLAVKGYVAHDWQPIMDYAARRVSAAHANAARAREEIEAARVEAGMA
jgi:hypothetical protein